jgi:flagellar protein FlbD
MITVTKLNHTPIVLNADLIENVEATPDTVVTLTSGRKIMVLESPQEIVRRTIQFRRKLYSVGPATGETNCLLPNEQGDSYGS